MKQFKVEIEGVTPYMQHRMDDLKLEEWEKKRGFIIEREDINKEALGRAEYHSYKNDKNQYYIPAEHIESGMIAGGAFDRVAHILGGKTFAEAYGSNYAEYLERERKNPTMMLLG